MDNNKVKVEIFGVKDSPVGGRCSCEGPCGPSRTMGELYSEFVNFIKERDIKDNVETEFIDVFEEDMSKYEYVNKALDVGYGLPLTAINKRVYFYGGISNNMIWDKINEELSK